jgi:hypothetical protein
MGSDSLQSGDQSDHIFSVDGLQVIALEELGYAFRVIGRGPIRKIGTVHNLRYRHELRHSGQRNVISDLSGVVIEAPEFTVHGGASNLACIRGSADRLDEDSVRKSGERASAVRPYPINILVLLRASAEDQAENKAGRISAGFDIGIINAAY